MTLRRILCVVVGCALLGLACTTDPDGARTDATNGPEQASEQAVPTQSPSPSVVPVATVSPTTTAVPDPDPTAMPTAAPTPVDTTPVVIQGDGWVITEADVVRLAGIVETVHELEFTSPVTVLVSHDVGEEYAPRFEPFSVEEWYLLRGLGLADTQADRDVANQVRRDRIRGLCCRFNDGTQVIVEVEATKLETEAIVVHELTHGLHTQHPELFDDTRFETDETPKPYAASIEGVPQFVAFTYLDGAPADELALVTPELPIIRPDMVPLIGAGPARHLNFHYATGPAFVDAIFDAQGIDGLMALLTTPPMTTEQILFPEKYLADEQAVGVPTPEGPVGISSQATGTIGAAMFLSVLVDGLDEATALELVEPWAGDRFIVYETDDGVCLVATIEMDTPEAAGAIGEALLEALLQTFPDTTATTTATDTQFELHTCEIPVS